MSDNIKFGQKIERDTSNFDCFIEDFKVWVEEEKNTTFPVESARFDSLLQEFAIGQEVGDTKIRGR